MNSTPATYSIRSATHAIHLSIPDRTISPSSPILKGEEAAEAFWNKKLAELDNQ